MKREKLTSKIESTACVRVPLGSAKIGQSAIRSAETVAGAQFPLWELASATDQPIERTTIRDEGDRGRRAAPDVPAPRVYSTVCATQLS